jgi:outer membrane protein assembly factor BamD (BamD/ComL family)
MNRTALVALLTVVAAGCQSASRDRSVPIPTEKPVAEARRLFAEAGRAYKEKRYDDAVDLYEDVYEGWPNSTLAPEAEYWAAESLYHDEELYASFKAFKRFLELYKLYARIDKIEARLYRTGVRLIEEGRGGLLGMGIFRTSDQGVEVLRYLVEQFPNGRYPDDALMAIGRYHRWTPDLPGAVETFKTLLDRYPRSEWRLQARLLLAASYRELNRGAPYDPGALRNARVHYVKYAEEASADPARATQFARRIELAKRRVVEIDETLGAHELLVARWYLHLEEVDAAAFYLTRAASIYAETEAGREAAVMLRTMGREVPEPGRGSGAGEETPPAAGS